jgi:hypothetical protein
MGNPFGCTFFNEEKKAAFVKPRAREKGSTYETPS